MTKTILAPAKINLCLHVLGKRPDGYHDLLMLMQRVSLYDRIDLTLTREEGVRVHCDGLVLAAGEENIASRAARRMLDLAGSPSGIEIVISKTIPVAAGLGGGSSDAAAVLSGLNEALGLELSREELMREGVKLGADVPFFLYESAAWARGIGDLLSPAPKLPDVTYVLVNPGIAVATAWVYQNLQLTSTRQVDKLPQFSATVPSLIGQLHNDLEPVTIGRFPVIAQVKERLLEAGAEGALMSGSGATVFGVFADKVEAERAADKLKGESGWRVFVVSPV